VSEPDDVRIEQSVRRTAGMRALKEIRGIVDEELRADAARDKLLRAYFRYGWIALLLAALLLVHYFGVI
jgi:hypothetical protein